MIKMKHQITQLTIEEPRPCVRCGYCCKKATCSVGLAHGAEPINCRFLIGNKPGEYSCFLADKEIYPDVKMHLGIGSGCCESLNTDRMIAELVLEFMI